MAANDLRQYLQNPNIRVALDVISRAEGTDKYGYATAFGGGQLPSLSDHPRQLHAFTQTDGVANKTSAAGRYQFLQSTWDDVSNKLGLQDFGPESQDLAALELLRRAGALDAAASGDFDTMVAKSGSTWASLPSSPYAQPKRSAGFIERTVNSLIPAAQAASAPQMNAPTQPKPWQAVVNSEQYQSLTPDQRMAAQRQYFDQVVAPRVPQEQIEAARNQFFTQYSQPRPHAPGGGIPEVRNQVISDNLDRQPEPERGFWQTVGDNVMEAGRQVGLTGRYALEGVGQAAGVVTEPIRQGLNVGLRAVGLPEASSTANAANSLADLLRLPEPQGSNERVVADIARTMAGAGSIAGGANLAARGASGVTQGVFNALGSSPTQQIVGAAGAGASGGAVREAGGGEVPQMLAAVAGGVAAPLVYGTVAGATSNLARRASALRPQDVESRVRTALAQSGVDYSALPARVRNSLNDQARRALASGDLDPAALARLSDFERIQGATPTRGMLTQDPQSITREMNLAKMQANSPSFGGANLSQIQQSNNASLVRALDNFGTEEPITAGQRAIGALERRLEANQSRINELYSSARDSAGRSFPLDGRFFADRAMRALDDELVGGSLPVDVRNHLNRISAGEVPFTVDYAEQLKTMIGRLQRNTSDGSARYALGLVRSALDDTPVVPLGGQTAAAGARQVNPGNLPALAGDASLGEDAISAFNSARRANRVMMRQIESSPALKALYDERISPDDFVNKYVISGSAKARDVQRLSRLLVADQGAFNAVKSGIIHQLKDKALSGIPDDIGSAKFSPTQYSKALKSIGDSKLRSFFSDEEIGQLHAISRAGRLMTNQPEGSAVNNSNTAASLASQALDALGGMGRGLRLFGIGEQVSSIQAGLAQRNAQRIAPAITLPTGGPEVNRFFPASMGALLLNSPAGAQDSQ